MVGIFCDKIPPISLLTFCHGGNFPEGHDDHDDDDLGYDDHDNDIVNGTKCR